MDAIIIGCGLSGSVIARQLASRGKKVLIWERRAHIGGNMYDYVDEHGFLVQKYGPHAFHTVSKELYDYVCQFEQWKPYRLTCGAKWDGKYTPTPFNFKTIDTFYQCKEAQALKNKIKEKYGDKKTATVVEVLAHEDDDIRRYAEFLFENDYAPYTAKQWGISPDKIDPSVLKRVPLRFSYEEGYFDDEYQIMPEHSYTYFFEKLLDHPNIRVELGVDAFKHISVEKNSILIDGVKANIPIIYTGALDELLSWRYGRLPYRSLYFEHRYTEMEEFQEAPIVAYPKERGYTRITEYKKLPVQKGKGSTYVIEYPLAYNTLSKSLEDKLDMALADCGEAALNAADCGEAALNVADCSEPALNVADCGEAALNAADCGEAALNAAEPYYPVLTEESQSLYEKYLEEAGKIENLVLCGRLADFKYYNMDQALARALEVSETIV